jgi:DNA mismatch repair protein MutS
MDTYFVAREARADTEEPLDSHRSLLLAQIMELKAAYPSFLLLCRVGAFYQMFLRDAQVASAALNIQSRDRYRFRGEPVPQLSIPIRAADKYCQDLLCRGHRIAIAEELESRDSARRRGQTALVRRDVVRLITPGRPAFS